MAWPNTPVIGENWVETWVESWANSPANDSVKNILNTENEGFRLIKIVVDGQEKEIYLGEDLLKLDVDSLDDWWLEYQEVFNGEVTYKIDSLSDPNHLELLDWEAKWSHLFSLDKAIEVAKSIWSRLPSLKEMEAIVKTIWADNLLKVFPGGFVILDGGLGGVWDWTIIPTSTKYLDNDFGEYLNYWVWIDKWKNDYIVIPKINYILLPAIFVKDKNN